MTVVNIWVSNGSGDIFQEGLNTKFKLNYVINATFFFRTVTMILEGKFCLTEATGTNVAQEYQEIFLALRCLTHLEGGLGLTVCLG